MGSSGKKKTTMAKLARENRLRERRLNKQAKKDARRQAPAHDPGMEDSPPGTLTPESTTSNPPGAIRVPAQPLATLKSNDAADDRIRFSGDMSNQGEDAASALGRDDQAARTLGPTDSERGDPRDTEAALLRLRHASDEEPALFEGRLRHDALEAGASERQIRAAQRNHPGHGD